MSRKENQGINLGKKSQQLVVTFWNIVSFCLSFASWIKMLIYSEKRSGDNLLQSVFSLFCKAWFFFFFFFSYSFYRFPWLVSKEWQWNKSSSAFYEIMTSWYFCFWFSDQLHENHKRRKNFSGWVEEYILIYWKKIWKINYSSQLYGL